MRGNLEGDNLEGDTPLEILWGHAPQILWGHALQILWGHAPQVLRGKSCGNRKEPQRDCPQLRHFVGTLPLRTDGDTPSTAPHTLSHFVGIL